MGMFRYKDRWFTESFVRSGDMLTSLNREFEDGWEVVSLIPLNDNGANVFYCLLARSI